MQNLNLQHLQVVVGTKECGMVAGAGVSLKLRFTFFMLLPRELMRSLQVQRIPVYHHPRTHVVGVSAGGKMTIASVTATTFECYLYEIFHRRRPRRRVHARAPKRHRECRPSAPVYAPILFRVVALPFFSGGHHEHRMLQR